MAMELYDAPMLDAGLDADVPMGTLTYASPKAWAAAATPHTPHVEMGDEEAYAEVEIDMDGYEEGAEYEMEDGEAAAGDVDFADAQEEVVYAVDVLVPVQEHEMAEHAEVAEQEALAAEQDATVEPVVAGATVAEHEQTDAQPAPDDDAADAAEPEPFDAPSELHPEFLAERADADADAPADGPYEEYEDAAGIPYEEGAEDGDVGQYDDASDAQYAEPETEPARAGSGDPHEIADGTFIEPPPAVLLAVPGASYALFNAPAASSSSADVPVLLAEQPALFFSPLSDLFAALRADAAVCACLPGIELGELMLGAAELQLVLGEDNVFAREVSLHELNALHDGAGREGPLSLSVMCAPVRFATRYYALRAEVERMQGAEGEGEEAYGHAPGDGEVYEEAPAGEYVVEHEQGYAQDGAEEQHALADQYAQEPEQAYAQDGAAEQHAPTGEYAPEHNGGYAQEGTEEQHAAPANEPAPAYQQVDLLTEQAREHAAAQQEQALADAADADPPSEATLDALSAAAEPLSPVSDAEDADASVHEVPTADAHALEQSTADDAYAHADPVAAPAELAATLDADNVHARADTDADAALAPESTEYAETVEPHEEDERAGGAEAQALGGALEEDDEEEEGEVDELDGGSEETYAGDGGEDALYVPEAGDADEGAGEHDEGAYAGEQDEYEEFAADGSLHESEEYSHLSHATAQEQEHEEPTDAAEHEQEAEAFDDGASGADALWDEEPYDAVPDTAASAADGGQNKRRFDDIDEFEEGEDDLDTLVRPASLSPDPKRARVE